MKRPSVPIRILAIVGVLTMAVGASLPQAMVGPGEWEISKTASARGERICLPDPAALMQWEHRGKTCRRTVLNSTFDRAEVSYSCNGAGFGTSRVRVVTPRSIKIDTQGIAGGLPFGYVIHARRIGDCGRAQAAR